MLWRRKKRNKLPLDFSALAAYANARPALGIGHISPDGPTLALPPLNGPAELASFDMEDAWQRFPETMWELLKKTRARTFFPNDPCEFDRYLDLLRRLAQAELASSGTSRFAKEIFIGVAEDGQPILVPRHVFANHGYILGATGSGKSSHAMAQLMIQLALPEIRIGHFDPATSTFAAPADDDYAPILLIDAKEGGDPLLRALAERIARARGQQLMFFSTESDFQSLTFDALEVFRRIRYPKQRVELLLKAFGLIYKPGFGETFFTNEQRAQLDEILCDRPVVTLEELVLQVKAATRGKSGNADARGLYGAFRGLRRAENIYTGGSRPAPEQMIDFERFYENREVIYIHLSSHTIQQLSGDVARLMLFTLLVTAVKRNRRNPAGRTQAYVFLDEFQRIAARPIVSMLEDCRSEGLGFILSHQSPKPLQRVDDEDLFGQLWDIANFKHLLTVTDERLLRFLEPVTPDRIEKRCGGGKSEGWTVTRSYGNSVSGGFFAAHTFTDSESSAFSNGKSTSENWHEERVSGRSRAENARITDTNLLAVVHVTGAGDCTTPTGGVPTVVQGLYPLARDVAKAMAETPWPQNPERGDDYFFRHSERKAAVPAGPPEEEDGPHPEPFQVAPEDRELAAGFEERLDRLASRLAHQMVRA